MISHRPLVESDFPALQAAIDADTFHPGQWEVSDFQGEGIFSETFEDENGPIVFVQYSADSDTRLRICTMWTDSQNLKRNAPTIVYGITAAVERARAVGFDELIFSTDHSRLAKFMTTVVGFKHLYGNEYILPVKDNTHVRT